MRHGGPGSTQRRPTRRTPLRAARSRRGGRTLGRSRVASEQSPQEDPAGPRTADVGRRPRSPCGSAAAPGLHDTPTMVGSGRRRGGSCGPGAPAPARGPVRTGPGRVVPAHRARGRGPLGARRYGRASRARLGDRGSAVRGGTGGRRAVAAPGAGVARLAGGDRPARLGGHGPAARRDPGARGGAAVDGDRGATGERHRGAAHVAHGAHRRAGCTSRTAPWRTAWSASSSFWGTPSRDLRTPAWWSRCWAGGPCAGHDEGRESPPGPVVGCLRRARRPRG